MGEVQRSLISEEDLPPAKGKRRRMPARLTPAMRKFLTKLARIGARVTWCIELLYDPTSGGQGELCSRAKACDHTLVLDTVREVEYRAAALAEDIEAFMTPPDRLPSEPGKPARVEAMARRQAAKQHIFDCDKI
jgi:hypothetical protein